MKTSEDPANGAATWQQRFREPQILFAKLAPARTERGLVLTNRFSGAYDLCAWSVPDGQLRPLTGDPGGHNSGRISPDGTHVYFLKDQQGNELGHLVRLPFTGGAIADLSPAMAAEGAEHTGAIPLSRAFSACIRIGLRTRGVAPRLSPRLFAPG
jgi:hypothetical protein